MKAQSSNQETENGVKIDNLGKQLKEESHLSGAYIRSLVKHLTSSRIKDPMNPNGSDPCQNLTQFGQKQPPHQPQHHKKQVRRRLHTSRPYQERLLNMAEARREIVTALKFHRAAMKQAQEQQQSPAQLQPPMLQPCFEQEAKMKSRRNSRMYPSFSGTADDFGNYMPVSTLVAENLNFILPNQALGLNLNFHDFGNLDGNNSPSIYSSSSPCSSTSPTLSIATEELPMMSQEGPPVVVDGGIEGLHPAMDDDEMAEIRSIGEQHQVEWNDTMNLVTSAWWFKFLKTMELNPEVNTEDDGFHPFDQVMEFPAWLSANESCLQQNFNYNFSNDYSEDPALPCMDIGEFEGMDEEWLA